MPASSPSLKSRTSIHPVKTWPPHLLMGLASLCNPHVPRDHIQSISETPYGHEYFTKIGGRDCHRSNASRSDAIQQAEIVDNFKNRNQKFRHIGISDSYSVTVRIL